MKKKFLTICLALFLVFSTLKFQEVKASTLSGKVTSIDGREIPITITYEGSREKEARIILDTIVESFPLLEDIWGIPYPYKSITVEAYYKGPESGMISLGYNSMGTFGFNTHSAANLERGTVIHELNHSWHNGKTGNDASRGTITGQWFNDASSMGNAHLVLEALGAQKEGDEELYYRTKFLVKYISYDVPLTKWGYQSGNTPEEQIKTLIGYSKGFLFWLRLYDVVGEDKLRRVWKRVFEDTPVETEALTKMIEEEYGKDLGWLWSGWLYPGQYQDSWWIDWRENLPRKIEKTRGDLDALKDGLYEDGFTLTRLEKSIESADALLGRVKVERAKESLKGIESEMAFISKFMNTHKEFKAYKETNKEIIEKYGGSLELNKKTDHLKSQFNSGNYVGAQEGLEKLYSEAKSLVEAVTSAQKMRQEIESFVESNKKDFEKEGFSIIPIEEKVTMMDEAFASSDFSSVASLSKEIKAMMNQAQEAFGYYKEAAYANERRGFFRADSSYTISEVVRKFNEGDYEKTKELSLQALEENDNINVSSVAIVFGFVIAVAGATIFLLKMSKSRIKIQEQKETGVQEAGETTEPEDTSAGAEKEAKRESEAEN